MTVDEYHSVTEKNQQKQTQLIEEIIMKIKKLDKEMQSYQKEWQKVHSPRFYLLMLYMSEHYKYLQVIAQTLKIMNPLFQYDSSVSDITDFDFLETVDQNSDYSPNNITSFFISSHNSIKKGISKIFYFYFIFIFYFIFYFYFLFLFYLFYFYISFLFLFLFYFYFYLFYFYFF